MSILHNLFQNIEEEGTLPHSFYKTTITLTPKPERQRTHTYTHKRNATG